MPLKLLIVDDSSTVRNRIARVAGSGLLTDIQVMAQARDGREAMRIVNSVRPELVTIDLTMPDLDGIATIPLLLRANPRVRILVISVLADKRTAIQALTLGAKGFLAKPFSDDDLLLALLELSD